MEATTRPDFSDLLTEVSSDAKAFWHAQREYTLLVASEKAAKAGRSMIGGMIILALVSLVVLMMSMAAAYLVADRAVDLQVYREARDRRFAGFPERPVATTVTVSGTTLEGMLVLLEGVAVVPD